MGTVSSSYFLKTDFFIYDNAWHIFLASSTEEAFSHLLLRVGGKGEAGNSGNTRM
jgi:hypothetical protein